MKLNNLRKKLADIDRRLLAVVKDRQNLSHEIGDLKREAGLGTRDYHQETQVVERGRAVAAELGLSPRMVEELLLVLIRSSLTVQEQDRVSATGEGSGKRVLVIGGAGKMGLWMARFLASQGYSVEIADPEGPVEGFDHVTDWKNSTLDHDVIVVAAPLRTSNEILMALAERRPPGLVFDVGSLKSPLRAGLQALTKNGVRVTSVHPMFGPTTKLLSGRHVIFINLGHEEAVAQAFINLLQNAVRYSPEKGELIVRAWSDGKSLLVSVADSGIGIAEDEQKRIWDDYYRTADARALGTRGSGLGLSLVSHIMKAHGGKSRLVSVPEEGSEFTLAFPLEAGTKLEHENDR